jgi:hypothetical protein
VHWTTKIRVVDTDPVGSETLTRIWIRIQKIIIPYLEPETIITDLGNTGSEINLTPKDWQILTIKTYEGPQWRICTPLS